jgi:hypothetical protein
VTTTEVVDSMIAGIGETAEIEETVIEEIAGTEGTEGEGIEETAGIAEAIVGAIEEAEGAEIAGIETDPPNGET